MTAIPLGQSRSILQGKNVAILNFGTLLPEAQKAAEALGATLVDMRFVKPLDEKAVSDLAATHELLVTLEDGAIKGGAGSEVAEYLFNTQTQVKLLQCGLPDTFIMQGTQAEMYAEHQIDGAGIVAQVNAFLNV
jgi:1-deoxy-D-xylulose-5-phosphate synthase